METTHGSPPDNAVRFWLTFTVGSMRDAEDRSGDSPAWGDYKTSWQLHQWMSLVWAVSLLYGSYRVVAALWTPVLIFG